MSVTRHLQHIKSSTINDGLPKAPGINVLKYGEIGINYASGCETMFIKNSNNSIVEFTQNTNIYTDIIKSSYDSDTVKDILTTPTLRKYTDFNIAFTDGTSNGNIDLTQLILYIYDIKESIHIILNVPVKEKSYFIIDKTILANRGFDSKSSVIGFTNYDDFFAVGDSDGMNGIDIMWNGTDSSIIIRHMYTDKIYRLNGNNI